MYSFKYSLESLGLLEKEEERKSTFIDVHYVH